ncbi:unnamed protein product [Rhizopus stolonifer]
MVQRPENIAKVIDGVERYNSDNVQVLENYLNENGQYDSEANLAILKLYQFNPSLAKEPVIVKILVQSLITIPAPDFSLCLYLLSDYANLESISKLTRLQQLLEQAPCRVVPNFENEMRKVIARVVAMSYQTLTASTLVGYLGLKEDEFEKFCVNQGWEKRGDLVQIPSNKDNEAKTVVIGENIRFEQLTKVIGYSNEM